MLKIGSWWYVSTFAVLFGVVFSDCREMILKRIRTRCILIFFIVLYVGILWLGDFNPYSLRLIAKMVLSIVFPCMICVIMKNRRIEIKGLNLFGNCSYEIYLVQGLLVQYLKLPWNPAYINEVASIVNVALSMLLGYLVSKSISLIFKCVRRSKI